MYNTTFYAPPVVLVSVHHQYNRQNKKYVPPENNIITAWVEVRYVFSVYSRPFSKMAAENSNKLKKAKIKNVYQL